MKLFAFSLAAACVVFLSGCASDVEKEFGQEITRIQPTEPPNFMKADVANLFGKANFSARLEVQKGLAGSRPPMVGELSGRDGSLFFISDQERGKRGLASGLSALWDGPTQTAYLLNEPLQAYAPIRRQSTNGPVAVTQSGEEAINGEQCRKSIVSQQVGTESIPILIVWRSIDKQDLPIKIQTTNNTAGVTLTLSRVRMQAPPAELFELPNGFKRYDSTDAMLSELVRRKTDAVTARGKKHRERYGVPKEEDDNFRGINSPIQPY